MATSNNAMRFISAYNDIEQALRQQYNLRQSISYTEAIRIASRSNSLIKKYEDDLIDYGRLRNAIVHGSNDKRAMAEPYIEAVEDFERLAKLICTPPLALSSVAIKEVKCVEPETSLKDVMVQMYKTGFSNFPVYQDDMLVGVANAGKITRWIGKKMYNKDDVQKVLLTPISEVVKDSATDNFYTVVDGSITLDKIMNLFTENRMLVTVIITKNGLLRERPIGIITAADIIEINKIMEDY